MKTIFNGNRYQYSQDASDFSNKIEDAMRPIFEEYLTKGYGPRELGYLAMMSSSDVSLTLLLDIQADPDRYIDDSTPGEDSDAQ
jgi:hypothetical protein